LEALITTTKRSTPAAGETVEQRPGCRVHYPYPCNFSVQNVAYQVSSVKAGNRPTTIESERIEQSTWEIVNWLQFWWLVSLTAPGFWLAVLNGCTAAHYGTVCILGNARGSHRRVASIGYGRSGKDAGVHRSE